MSELLPCPFCPEKEAKDARPMVLSGKKKHFDDIHFTVQCTNCGCEPDFCVETEEEAINHWNTREILPDTDAAITGFNIAKKRIIEMINMLHCKKQEEIKKS